MVFLCCTASRAAETIATDLIAIGHRTSGASIADGPVYYANKIPAISGTKTADQLTAVDLWYFRATYNNALQADFVANYVNSTLGYNTATLVSSSRTAV